MLFANVPLAHQSLPRADRCRNMSGREGHYVSYPSTGMSVRLKAVAKEIFPADKLAVVQSQNEIGKTLSSGEVEFTRTLRQILSGKL